MRDPLFDLFDKVFDREMKKPDRSGWDTTNINGQTGEEAGENNGGSGGSGGGSGGGPGAGKNGGGREPKKKGIRLPKLPGKGALIALVAVLLYGTVGSCYYVLDEDNYAVVTTLGSPQAISQAGLHFKLPVIQRVTKVSKVIKGMPIGYIPETDQTISEEAIMITKDFNFVNTDFYLE